MTLMGLTGVVLSTKKVRSSQLAEVEKEVWCVQ